MNAAAQLIESASDAGLTLIPTGDRLRVRGAEPVLADDLLEDLRRWKPAILDHLREDAERRHQVAVWDACDRLDELYRRVGKPSDWLTPAVKTTEAAVEWFWIEARRRRRRAVPQGPRRMGGNDDRRDHPRSVARSE